MDVFVTLAQAKLDLICSSEEVSWLQNLFHVLFDNIYKCACFTMSCEEICLQILNIVMSANGNCIPTNHVVLTVKDLSNFANSVSFVGSFGNTTSELMGESSQIILGYSPLEERKVILIGYLTASPKSRTSLIPGAGLLYLEDKKNAMMCQVCKPEKHFLNKFVLLPKWNFISCHKFPVLIFEGDTSEAVSCSKFGYVEVVEDCVFIGDECQKSACDIPKSFSVGDYAKMENKSEKFNLRGCLVALSPIHRYTQNNSKGKPFFLAQLKCDETQYSAVVIFQGEKFSHWHNFLTIDKTFVISNLLETTMNKGQPSERKVLATTRYSNFFEVEEQASMTSVLLESISCEETGSSAEEKKRKRDEPRQTGRNNTAQVKRLKVETQSCSERSTTSVVTHCSKSEKFWCSPPMAYQGVLTAIINIEAGVYEIDNRMKLYTHYQPCTNFGCAMRVGAVVSLHNVHLCKPNKEVLGFCCCTYSTIRVAQHSKLASPFKVLVPSLNHFYRICQQLSLVQFIRFLELIDLLIKKFNPTLSSNPLQPTIVSHVLDLASLSSTSSRDIYQEFFGNPHSCLVSQPAPRDHTIPEPLTLHDILNAIDRLGTQDTEKPYGWHYKEITNDEISKDMVLIGWLSSCSKAGQLCLCDETAKIPCLIVETEVSKTIHKCTSSCLQERNLTLPTIVADTMENHCPLVQTSLSGAILKVEHFKIVIETFFWREQSSVTGMSGEKILTKSYLVFSLRHTRVLGMVPTIQTLGISTNRRKAKADKGKEGPEDTSQRCYVFLVKSKEIKSLDLKENNPSLTSCVQGYILGEVKEKDIENPNNISLEAHKKSVILRFEKDCSALAFLHSGCLYYVTERCHVGKTSKMQEALDLKRMCPVIEMNSSMSFEQIDRRLSSQDVYREWRELSERYLKKISSVRESLCIQNQSKKDFSSGSNVQEPRLFSFRGIIVNRENVFPNQSDESCPFPTIPSGQMYLPHYGLISRSEALALSLGFCFLGIRQLVLTVRDIETADTVKVYLDLCTHGYPWGLVPGAVVTFLLVSHHTSRKGNIYFSFKACSDVIVESLSSVSSISEQNIPRSHTIPRPPDSDAMQVRHLIDFSDCQRHDQVMSTVAYILCRVTAVQRVGLKWTCSRCGKLANNCYCSITGAKHSWMFGAQARCVVEDGTGEAILYVENDHVKDLLMTNDTSWTEIKELSQKQGELWYQRSAYWKSGARESETRADTILSNIASSPHVFRRIKVLCKQFRLSFWDNIEKDEGKDKEHETRTIIVDRNEHSTYILGKVNLNVLDINEVNSKEEASRLIEMLTKNSKSNSFHCGKS